MKDLYIFWRIMRWMLKKNLEPVTPETRFQRLSHQRHAAWSMLEQVCVTLSGTPVESFIANHAEAAKNSL